jgi:esterase/lipase superfamily enzyme
VTTADATWTWRSHRLGKDMTVARWGLSGKPVLIFPTASADCYDYERFLMIQVLQPLISAGRIRVYCCETNLADSWCDGDAHPLHKSFLQTRLDAYVEKELLPHLARDNGGRRDFVVAGASLGAFNAVNTAAKHPEWFSHVVAMSGTYDFDRWMSGMRDDNYYFNQPMLYLAGVGPGPQRDGIRGVHWVIASGQGRYEAPDESRRIAALLERQGAHVNLELWGGDVHHDWVTWRAMLPLFLDKLLP